MHPAPVAETGEPSVPARRRRSRRLRRRALRYLERVAWGAIALAILWALIVLVKH